MLTKLKALYVRVPAEYKKEAVHVFKVFVFTFVAVAAPLAPAVLSSPSFSAVKALFVAGVAAAGHAAWSASKAYAVAAYKKRTA